MYLMDQVHTEVNEFDSRESAKHISSRSYDEDCYDDIVPTFWELYKDNLYFRHPELWKYQFLKNKPLVKQYHKQPTEKQKPTEVSMENWSRKSKVWSRDQEAKLLKKTKEDLFPPYRGECELMVELLRWLFCTYLILTGSERQVTSCNEHKL